MPGAVVAVGAGGAEAGAGGTCIVVGAIDGALRFGFATTEGADVGAEGVAGGELRGAPTAMSQRCPGSPCGGFIPAAVVIGWGAGGATEGEAEGEAGAGGGFIVPEFSVEGT